MKSVILAALVTVAQFAAAASSDEGPAKEVTVNQFQHPYSLHSRYPEAGGGLFGSPMDMIKFFSMVANGGVGLNGKGV